MILFEVTYRICASFNRRGIQTRSQTAEAMRRIRFRLKMEEIKETGVVLILADSEPDIRKAIANDPKLGKYPVIVEGCKVLTEVDCK